MRKTIIFILLLLVIIAQTYSMEKKENQQPTIQNISFVNQSPFFQKACAIPSEQAMAVTM